MGEWLNGRLEPSDLFIYVLSWLVVESMATQCIRMFPNLYGFLPLWKGQPARIQEEGPGQAVNHTDRCWPLWGELQGTHAMFCSEPYPLDWCFSTILFHCCPFKETWSTLLPQYLSLLWNFTATDDTVYTCLPIICMSMLYMERVRYCCLLTLWGWCHPL